MPVAGANRLRDQYRCADVDGGEDRDDKEHDLEPGADAGHRSCAKAGHHESVHSADRRLQQVLPDDGRRQAEHAALGHGFGRGVLWLGDELRDHPGRRGRLGDL